MLSDFSNKWFNLTIRTVSPDFKGGLPALGRNFVRYDRPGFVDKKNKDVAKRLRLQEFDAQASYDEYKKLVSSLISRFDPLLHEFDRKEVMNSTTALSLISVSHTDLDELGDLGRNTDYEYPADVFDAVCNYYKAVKAEFSKTLTLPRGKNAAYPLAVPGMHREANNVAIGLQAAIALSARNQGISLREMGKQLEKSHGEAITIYGERRQHTGKVMPLSLNVGERYSTNFEPRVRGIYMSPKFCVAYNRKTVKKALAVFLKSSIHIQDRPTITKRIDAAVKKGWKILAIDWSKFDQHFGGKRGRQCLKVIHECFNVDTTLDDLVYEFEIPLVTFRQGSPYINRAVPILMSGASFTSAVGCVGNVLSLITMLKEVTGKSASDLLGSMGREWDYLAWGDDTICMCPETFAKQEDILAATSVVKMSADVEPAIRYLGSIYGDGGGYTGIPKGYLLGRAVQQQFLPERPKIYPFGLIGYIARLMLMGDVKGAEFHKEMKFFWDPEILGKNYFPFSERIAVLEKTVPLVNKYAARIADLDDILMTLTHGVGEDALELDVNLDSFHELIGLTQVDVSDPEKFLKEQEKPMSPGFFKLFARFLKGDMQAYQLLITQFVIEQKLEWRPGDLVY
jgi:hypothetical protein